MKSKIDIRSGQLFPWQFQIIAIFLIVFSVGLVQNNFWVALVLLIVGLFIVSGYEGVEIDKAARTYREYQSFFLIKTGKPESYDKAEKIFINRGRESQQMHTAYTNHSSTFTNEVYNGYLKLSSGEKIHLIRKKNKEKLKQKLSGLSSFLNLEVTDNS